MVQMNEQSLVISMLQCRTKGSNEWAVSGYFYVTIAWLFHNSLVKIETLAERVQGSTTLLYKIIK